MGQYSAVAPSSRTGGNMLSYGRPYVVPPSTACSCDKEWAARAYCREGGAEVCRPDVGVDQDTVLYSSNKQDTSRQQAPRVRLPRRPPSITRGQMATILVAASAP